MTKLAAVDINIEEGLEHEKQGHYLIATRLFRVADTLFEEGSDDSTEIYYSFRSLQELAQEHYHICKSKLPKKQQRWISAERYNPEMRGGLDLVHYDLEQVRKHIQWLEEHEQEDKQKTNSN